MFFLFYWLFEGFGFVLLVFICFSNVFDHFLSKTNKTYRKTNKKPTRVGKNIQRTNKTKQKQWILGVFKEIPQRLLESIGFFCFICFLIVFFALFYWFSFVFLMFLIIFFQKPIKHTEKPIKTNPGKQKKLQKTNKTKKKNNGFSESLRKSYKDS